MPLNHIKIFWSTNIEFVCKSNFYYLSRFMRKTAYLFRANLSHGSALTFDLVTVIIYVNKLILT